MKYFKMKRRKNKEKDEIAISFIERKKEEEWLRIPG